MKKVPLRFLVSFQTFWFLY